MLARVLPLEDANRFAHRLVLIEAAQGHSPIEQEMLNEGVLRYDPVKTANPGTSSTRSALLGTHKLTYHKRFDLLLAINTNVYSQRPDDVPLNECVSWRLAERLGSPYSDLVAVCVLREILDPTDGLLHPGCLSLQKKGIAQQSDVLRHRPDDCMDAAFFDCVTGQQDRHWANFRWESPHGRLGLIDHGYSFALPNWTANVNLFLDERCRAQRQKLSSHEANLLHRLEASGDVLGVADLLRPEQAQAMIDRIRRMVATGALLAPADF